MELTSVKLLVMTLSGVIRILFGMFPLIVVKTLVKKWSRATDQRMKKVISILMFFGGGVLLATCFLHMMPEVRENFAKAAPDTGLPIAEVIFITGFFLVFLIEDMVHSHVHKRNHNKKKRNNGATTTSTSNGKAIVTSNGENENSLSLKERNLVLSCGTLTNGDKSLCNSNSNDQDVVDNNTNSGIIITCNNTTPVTPPTVQQLSLSNEHKINPNQLRETRDIFRKTSLSQDEIPGLAKSRVQNGMGGITNGAFVTSEKFQYNDPDWWKDIVNSNANGNIPQVNIISSNNNTPVQNMQITQDGDNLKDNNNKVQKGEDNSHHNNKHNNGHGHSHKHNGHNHMPLPSDEDDSIGGEIRNILIVIAISFHGVFEGMAIGLQTSEMDVWYLFLAVSLHECTILFCIGIELISSKTKVFRMILYILVVSLVSPIGIAVGIIVTENSFGSGKHQALIVGCMQGLAAGTLLYVTFFEIFQEEGRKLQRKFFHILVAIVGFLLMGSIEFMGGHSHGGKSHSHHGNSSSIIDDHDDHTHEGHAPTGHHFEMDDHHNHTDHDHDHHH